MTITRIGLASDATWARAWEVADTSELTTLLATFATPLGPKRGDIIVQLDDALIWLLVSANLVVQVNQLATLQGTNTFTGANTFNNFAIELGQGQIQFPTPQVPSAIATVLDDYREGNWTMVIGGDGGTSGQTYSTQAGRYQKIGRKVEIWGVAQLSNKGTITGNVEIQGLPFPCTNSDGTFRSPCAMNFFDLATNQISVQGTTIQNTSTLIVRALAAAATAMGNVLTTADITNTTALSFTTSYLTDD